MPIIRKVIAIGGSHGITIPKDWLEWIERQTGTKVTEVTIEVNGILKIAPVIEKEAQKVE